MAQSRRLLENYVKSLKQQAMLLNIINSSIRENGELMLLIWLIPKRLTRMPSPVQLDKALYYSVFHSVGRSLREIRSTKSILASHK